MPSSTPEPCSSTAPSQNPSKLGHYHPSKLGHHAQPAQRRPKPSDEEYRKIGLGPFGILGRHRFLPACVRRAALAGGLAIADVDFACYLATYCDRYGAMGRKQTTLAAERQVTERQLRRRFGALIKAGILIRIRRGRGLINRYQFCFRPHSPQPTKVKTGPLASGLDRTREVRSSIEPLVQEPLYGTHAAAEVQRYVPARTSATEQQQQQTRLETRIEGLIAAIAARSRKVGRRFDEAATRQRIAAGRLDVNNLQALADELRNAGNGNSNGQPFRKHQIVAALSAGGKCEICGTRRPDPAERCPGPKGVR